MNNVITNIINKHNPKESFYIIDLEKIKNLYKNWMSLLPLVKPYYAVKSNNNPILLKALICNSDLSFLGFTVSI